MSSSRRSKRKDKSAPPPKRALPTRAHILRVTQLMYLEKSELGEVEAAFRKYTADDGFIDYRGLKKVFSCTSAHHRRVVIKTLFRYFDIDESGRFNAPPALVMLSVFIRGSFRDKLHLAFRLCDRYASGKLYPTMLQDMLSLTCVYSVHLIFTLIELYIQAARSNVSLLHLSPRDMCSVSDVPFTTNDLTAAVAEVMGTAESVDFDTVFAWASNHPVLSVLFSSITPDVSFPERVLRADKLPALSSVGEARVRLGHSSVRDKPGLPPKPTHLRPASLRAAPASSSGSGSGGDEAGAVAAAAIALVGSKVPEHRASRSHHMAAAPVTYAEDVVDEQEKQDQETERDRQAQQSQQYQDNGENGQMEEDQEYQYDSDMSETEIALEKGIQEYVDQIERDLDKVLEMQGGADQGAYDKSKDGTFQDVGRDRSRTPPKKRGTSRAPLGGGSTRVSQKQMDEFTKLMLKDFPMG